ncbi:BamA/TamA family outer membrane protein [candidate division KSB1 bacterium]|nr:BamA/TamA family outer membrane protein [candidate division KSB1 bacterium]
MNFKELIEIGLTAMGFTGPTNGARSNFSITYSPGLGENGLDFFTARGEWRRYYKAGAEYRFALRLAGGLSEGRNPQQFFLGGVDNWFNQRFKDGYLRVDRIEDIYFSRFETPFRGLDFYERIGNRFALANLEFRFPLIRYLQLGFPLPLTFYNVRGALFTDIGTAWNKNEPLVLWHSERKEGFHLHDLLMTYGVSARTNLGFLILTYDVAWRTDLQNMWKPRHLLSAGVEF